MLKLLEKNNENNENISLLNDKYITTKNNKRKLLIIKLFFIVSCLFIIGLYFIKLNKNKNNNNTKDISSTSIQIHKHIHSNESEINLEPLCDKTVYQQTGYIKIPEKENDYYFYWFFESRQIDPTTAPFVLWLTGGPGCSSMFAIIKENGPCQLIDNNTNSNESILIDNPYSWNTNANMLWLDQPSNVGFSYGTDNDYDHNENNVKKNIYFFLQKFFKKNPKYKNNDFYIIGESYAGHYVPATAAYIKKKNNEVINNTNKSNNSMNDDIYIHLKGISIGNGLTDPPIQTPHTIDMARYSNTTIGNDYNIDLVTEDEFNTMKHAVPKCEHLLIQCQDETDDIQLNDNFTNINNNKTSSCIEALTFCSMNLLYPMLSSSHRNPYDIRMTCGNNVNRSSNSIGCYDMNKIENFFNNEKIKKELNIIIQNNQRVKKWKSCNMKVTQYFLKDYMKSQKKDVLYLLNDTFNQSIRIHIYAGNADLMCNWIGNDLWTKNLPWKEQIHYNNVKIILYKLRNSNQSETAELRMFKGLSFMKIFNAGHMVPMDQPALALQMFNDFISNNLHK